MHTTPDGWRGPGRKVRNAFVSPGRVEHECWPPIPIRVRIVWDDTGEERWMETVAAGWTGRLVRVDATPIKRSHDYDFNYVWLHANDVKRI